MITDIDYNRLRRWLLPVRLRTAGMLAWLKALTIPISKRLYDRFKFFEREAWYQLKYQSGQVAYLEYVLNDKFDTVQKRIYISGASYASNMLYLYTDPENQEIPIFRDVEGEDVYLFTDAELLGNGGNNYDFTIHVPMGLPNEELSLRAVADRYKRDSKIYNIVYF